MVVWPDNDFDGQRYARTVAELVLDEGASKARIVQLPEGLPSKWDLADPVPDGVDVERLVADADPVVSDVAEPDTIGEREGQEQPLSARDLLLQLANEQQICSAMEKKA